MDKPVRQPGPGHPITIEPTAARVVVRVNGTVLADTGDALTLREAGHAPVQYVPLSDVDQAQLERSDHATYCPYKGDASYYSVPLAGERGRDAVWEYREPFDAVAEIRGRVAFYPDRVELSLEPSES